MEIVDIALYIGYALTGLATVLAIVLPLLKALDNPKGLMKSLVGVLVVAGIFGVGFALAGSEVTTAYAKFDVTPFISQMVGASLITAYVFMVGAFVLAIFTEFAKAFK